MHNRVGRALIVLGAVLALLTAGPATTAAAKAGDTIHSGNKVCSMYVNSVGFGAYCSSGEAYLGTGHIPTWRERLGNNVFIPCRDFPVPRASARAGA